MASHNPHSKIPTRICARAACTRRSMHRIYEQPDFPPFSALSSKLISRIWRMNYLQADPPQQSESLDVRLPRLPFEVPDRSDLPALHKYAHVVLPDGAHKTSGYTESSRGCKHLCRHCPIVPVYKGQFRIVPQEVVLADIRQQVAAGAEHITFGDPDFFNGITHATRIVEALHAEHPQLTYDVTIKVEHLLRHADALPTLARTGCLFLTSAVESLDDDVLLKLEKGHTRADVLPRS